MRKSLFTEAQIIGILKQAEAGRMAPKPRLNFLSAADLKQVSAVRAACR